jgi:hypothetical protein
MHRDARHSQPPKLGPLGITGSRAVNTKAPLE